MQRVQRIARYCVISMAAIILAACAGQKEPARKLIGDIEVTVAAASAEAAKYVPDQLGDVQSKLAALKASFGKQDYAAVLTAGPAVLSAAQGLATAAAAKKDEILKGLNDKWTGLAACCPGKSPRSRTASICWRKSRAGRWLPASIWRRRGAA